MHRPRNACRRTPSLTVLTCLLAISPDLAAQRSPEQKITHRRVGELLDGVRTSGFDLAAAAPEAWVCKGRSPEWLAALDDRGRRAFGDGHIRVAAGASGWKLTAENVRSNRNLFNLGLAAFQLKIGADLAAVQAYLPAAAAAILATAIASPLTHDALLVRDQEIRRIVLTAKKQDHPLRRVTFDLGPGDELRGARLENSDGSEIDLEITNRKTEWSDDLWVPVSLRANHFRVDGTAEILELDWGFAPLVDRPDKVLINQLRIARLDRSQKPIKVRQNDLNPWSFELWDCRMP